MKSIKSLLFVLIITIITTGCFHAKITTGAKPSADVVEQPFASSWINGLIPPSVTNVADECSNGVAIVETERSFVNMLAAFVTFSIYSPIHIKVTCAEGSGMSDASLNSDREISVSRDAAESDIMKVFEEAADKAVESGDRVMVRFK